jgi:hypothetical protein
MTEEEKDAHAPRTPSGPPGTKFRTLKDRNLSRRIPGDKTLGLDAVLA